jgi:hypothetical protein
MSEKKELQRAINFNQYTRCAVLDTSMTIGDKEISDYMRAITYNFLRNNYSHYKYKIYEENSVDKILKSIKGDPKEEDIVLVVVQAYGNFLYDTWKPLEHGYSLFREYCNEQYYPMAKENKFLVMGHILDDRENKNRWFRLHEQCFVINYKLWKELGEPKFGDFGVKQQEVRQAIRSRDNFHDSHTPKFLAPGPAFETINKTGFGWNFINISLREDLAVPNFDEQARATKTYLYPEIKEEQAEFKKFFREGCADFKKWESDLDTPKADFLQYQQFTVERSPQAMWILNTESVNDIQFVPSKKPLRNLYSVAAGFKTFAFLRNWHHDTVPEDVNINYFDISQNALDVRKWVHEEWNPRDFNMYLDFLKENYYDKDIGLISIYEDFDYMSENWASERERAQEAYESSILRIFDNMEEWYEFFERVRHNNVTYTQANLIRDWNSLLGVIKPSDENFDDVLWSSNYITTRYTTWILSYEERREVYSRFMNDVSNINNQIRVHSADWDGSPTRGMRVEELNHAYNSMSDRAFIEWRKRRT